MATRKAQDDVLARTESERELAAVLVDEGVVSVDEAIDVARKVLGVLAKAVQFETATSKDPDRNIVANRRLVITGPWTVDPNGVTEQK